MDTPYQHTQHGPLWMMLGVPFAGALAAAVFAEEPALRVGMLLFAAFFALIAACFATLTVRDCGDHLDVRFGPLPWWGTRVRYDAILRVEPARSRLIDGFGIHWLPGRGWTFNLWGFDCVEITTDRRRLRIGTDDPDGLLRHLVARTGQGEAPA